MTNSRVVNVDIARGLGMASVVLGHNWIVLHDRGELFRIIYSFHLPLFLFLSGVFLDWRVEWREFFYSKAESLIKPYFVVSFFALAFNYALSYLKGEGRGELGDVVKIVYGTASVIPWSPLWFLPNLFLVSIFCLLIVKIFQERDSYYLWACAFFMLMAGVFLLNRLADWSPGVFGFSSMSKVGLPWSIDLIFVSSPFFVFGYLLRYKVLNFNINLIGLLFSISVFIGLHVFFDDTIDFNSRLYDNILVSTLEACCGIYIVLCLSSLFCKSKIVSKNIARLGSGSLFILLFHGVVQGVVFGFLSRLGGNFFVAGFLGFVVALVLPVCFLVFVQKNVVLSFLLLGNKKSS